MGTKSHRVVAWHHGSRGGALALSSAVGLLVVSLTSGAGSVANAAEQGSTSQAKTGPFLLAVSASSASDAWAVGTTPATAGGSRSPQNKVLSYAQHWDGTEWTQVATPSPGFRSSDLVAVSDLSATDAWAVGHTIEHGLHSIHPLIERWDGTEWTAVDTSKLHGVGALKSVVALSADDVWAVSDAYRVLHWDGSTWAEVGLPSLPKGDVAGTTSVSGTGPDDVWVVGGLYKSKGQKPLGTLIDHWDGTHWSMVSGGTRARQDKMVSVNALSSSDAWAVGTRNVEGKLGSFVEHWDGQSWTVDSTTVPHVPILNSVSGASTGDVWVVGRVLPGQGSEGFIEHFDGTSWTEVTGPRSKYGWDNVNADTPTDAWAVGDTGGLIHWDGTDWSTSPS